MKQNKWNFRSKIADVHLHDAMRIGTTSLSLALIRQV